MPNQPAALTRTLTLRGAVTLNLLDMIGVGPFITLPLLLAAMGGPQAMLGWVLGALLALCDGLVWAELGAAMPEAGGTYHYLRRMYGGRTGRLLSFLFCFQLCFSAPLSVASGCIGLSQYATYLVPWLTGQVRRTHAVHMGAYNAALSCGFDDGWLRLALMLLAVVLLYRNLQQDARACRFFLLATVLLTIGWAVVRLRCCTDTLGRRLHLRRGAFHLGPRVFYGAWLGNDVSRAMTTGGYYNVTFLGGEARGIRAGRFRGQCCISIAIVAALYLALNVSILSVLPSPQLLALQNIGGAASAYCRSSCRRRMRCRWARTWVWCWGRLRLCW